MPADPERPYTEETVRRMAEEQVGLAMTKEDVEGLAALLNNLTREIEPIDALVRDTDDPVTAFELERWER
jgi:hypothetical protein